MRRSSVPTHWHNNIPYCGPINWPQRPRDGDVFRYWDGDVFRYWRFLKGTWVQES